MPDLPACVVRSREARPRRWPRSCSSRRRRRQSCPAWSRNGSGTLKYVYDYLDIRFYSHHSVSGQNINFDAKPLSINGNQLDIKFDTQQDILHMGCCTFWVEGKKQQQGGWAYSILGLKAISNLVSWRTWHISSFRPGKRATCSTSNFCSVFFSLKQIIQYTLMSTMKIFHFPSRVYKYLYSKSYGELGRNYCN